MKLPTLALLSLPLVACGGGGGDQDFTTVAANASGVLLQGDDDDPAVAALRDMPPSAAPGDTIVDGLMTTRLEAVVHPDATVEDVNDALRDANAAIVSMTRSFPALTLVVPAMDDVDEALTRAAELEATDAFWLVSPSLEPSPLAPFAQNPGIELEPLDPWAPTLALLEEDASHLQAMRMEAAANAARAANAGPVPVFVPDYYSESTPDPSVTAQRVLNGPGLVSDPSIGNRGSMACAIMAVDSLDESFEGVHPTPGDNVALDSFLYGGLTWTERLALLPQFFPAGPFVLNTGTNYAGLGFGPNGTRTKPWRVVDALAWRLHSESAADSFVHFASAGDTGELCGDPGESTGMSPWTLAAAYADLAEAADDVGLDADLFDELLERVGGQPAAITNLRTIRSSRFDGERSGFSSRNADWRVLGENVETDCRTVGGPCTPDGATISTTRAACAQVSGLASWMWSIAPGLSPDDLLERLHRAWSESAVPGILDGYHATLGLDTPGELPVRLALLDVAGDADFFAPDGDGKFDDHDLAVFLTGWVQNRKRYDLNGDGRLGGEGRAPFDLTMDAPPEFTEVEAFVHDQLRTFDEASLTDLEVLCYYAYSDLFSGDAERRFLLLEDCLAPEQPEPLVLERLETQGYAFAQSTFVEVEDSFESEDLAGTRQLAQATVGGVRGSCALSATPEVDESGGFHRIELNGYCEAQVETLGKVDGAGTLTVVVGFSVPRPVLCSIDASFAGTAFPGGDLQERAALHVVLDESDVPFEHELGVPGGQPNVTLDAIRTLGPGYYELRVLVLARSWSEVVIDEPIDTLASTSWFVNMSLVEPPEEE